MVSGFGVGICCVDGDGTCVHKNHLATEMCPARYGQTCPLYYDYLAKDRGITNDLVLNSVIIKLHCYVNAVAIPFGDGFRIWLRKIQPDSELALLLEKDNLLSESEHRIFELFLLKKSNREISEITGTSNETVKTHLSHIFQKIDGISGLRSK